MGTSAALVAITDAPGGTAPGAARRRTGGSSSVSARGGSLMRQSSREAIEQCQHLQSRCSSTSQQHSNWHERERERDSFLLSRCAPRSITDSVIDTTNQRSRGGITVVVGVEHREPRGRRREWWVVRVISCRPLHIVSKRI